MALADQVFAGPTITVPDDWRDYGEPRFITAGKFDGRVGERQSDILPQGGVIRPRPTKNA